MIEVVLCKILCMSLWTGSVIGHVTCDPSDKIRSLCLLKQLNRDFDLVSESVYFLNQKLLFIFFLVFIHRFLPDLALHWHSIDLTLKDFSIFCFIERFMPVSCEWQRYTFYSLDSSVVDVTQSQCSSKWATLVGIVTASCSPSSPFPQPYSWLVMYQLSDVSDNFTLEW